MLRSYDTKCPIKYQLLHINAYRRHQGRVLVHVNAAIWITSNARPERSRAIHFFSRAADSVTKRREAADFDKPEPFGAGTPLGRRTER